MKGTSFEQCLQNRNILILLKEYHDSSNQILKDPGIYWMVSSYYQFENSNNQLSVMKPIQLNSSFGIHIN